MKCAAFSGRVEMRFISLKQRCCSGVPPGMNRVVKNRRKEASSLPQPSSARRHVVSASSRARCRCAWSRLKRPRSIARRCTMPRWPAPSCAWCTCSIGPRPCLRRAPSGACCAARAGRRSLNTARASWHPVALHRDEGIRGRPADQQQPVQRLGAEQEARGAGRHTVPTPTLVKDSAERKMQVSSDISVAPDRPPMPHQASIAYSAPP